MSLQERVLEVLGKQSGVPAKDIGALFPDVERVALDCCLNGLVHRNVVTLGAGLYSAVRAETAEPVKTVEIKVTAPVLESLGQLVRPIEPRTRRCRECREPKTLDQYPELGPQKRRGKTCNACREVLAEKKKRPVVADSVFERVQARRQEALNNLAVLRVDVANWEAVVGECDRFIELYGRFAAEGSEQR